MSFVKESTLFSQQIQRPNSLQTFLSCLSDRNRQLFEEMITALENFATSNTITPNHSDNTTTIRNAIYDNTARNMQRLNILSNMCFIIENELLRCDNPTFINSLCNKLSNIHKMQNTIQLNQRTVNDTHRTFCHISDEQFKSMLLSSLANSDT